MKALSKILFTFLFITGLLNISLAQDSDANHKFTMNKVWESPDLLTTSESICYDAERHILYVSCINGKPTEKDQNGFIAGVNLDGTIAILKWIDGLNAPKGMGISGNHLYVTDIDKVVQIDIDKTQIVKEYPVEGAQFLNDIVIDESGNVYISDMMTSVIHILNKEKIDLWLSDEDIEGSNGLLIQEGKLLIGTKSGIIAADLSDKNFTLLVPNQGGIDGLKAISKGNYIISDWSGKVQLVSTSKDPQELLNTTGTGVNAADLEYIPSENLLIIPTFMDNRITAYEIKQE